MDVKDDGAGGYYVGWISASEYLSYMVKVTEDGEEGNRHQDPVKLRWVVILSKD